MHKKFKALTIVILTVAVGGALLDPYWWYRFFYEHQYLSGALWMEAGSYAIYQWSWWIVFSIFIIFTILVLAGC